VTNNNPSHLQVTGSRSCGREIIAMAAMTKTLVSSNSNFEIALYSYAVIRLLRPWTTFE